MSTTEQTTQTARKTHRCSWCGEVINPGDTYARWRYFGDDGPSTVKMHPECDDAQKRHVDQGGENEFFLYESGRGQTEKEYWQAQAASGE